MKIENMARAAELKSEMEFIDMMRSIWEGTFDPSQLLSGKKCRTDFDKKPLKEAVNKALDERLAAINSEIETL